MRGRRWCDDPPSNDHVKRTNEPARRHPQTAWSGGRRRGARRGDLEAELVGGARGQRAALRAAHGLAQQRTVGAEQRADDGVVLRTVDQAVARAQAIAKKYAGHSDASVDAFLANRHADSGE